MVIIGFAVTMLLGLFLLFHGLRKTKGEWRKFAMPITFMVLSAVLFSCSMLGSIEDKVVRTGLSYTAVLSGILFLLTSLTAGQHRSNG